MHISWHSCSLPLLLVQQASKVIPAIGLLSFFCLCGRFLAGWPLPSQLKHFIFGNLDSAFSSFDFSFSSRAPGCTLLVSLPPPPLELLLSFGAWSTVANVAHPLSFPALTTTRLLVTTYILFRSSRVMDDPFCMSLTTSALNSA